MAAFGIDEESQTPTPGTPINSPAPIPLTPTDPLHDRAPDSAFSLDNGGMFPSGDIIFAQTDSTTMPESSNNSHGETVIRCKCGKMSIKIGKYAVAVVGTVLITIATLYFSGA